MCNHVFICFHTRVLVWLVCSLWSCMQHAECACRMQPLDKGVFIARLPGCPVGDTSHFSMWFASPLHVVYITTDLTLFFFMCVALYVDPVIVNHLITC
jgi:hypothetical protein